MLRKKRMNNPQRIVRFHIFKQQQNGDCALLTAVDDFSVSFYSVSFLWVSLL